MSRTNCSLIGKRDIRDQSPVNRPNDSPGHAIERALPPGFLSSSEDTNLETKLRVVDLAAGLDELGHANAEHVGWRFLFLPHLVKLFCRANNDFRPWISPSRRVVENDCCDEGRFHAKIWGYLKPRLR